MLLSYFPVLVMIGIASMMGMGALFMSFLFRPQNPYAAKNAAWECGMEPIGEANTGHFKVQFFIIAILFIVFDVETIFLFPWAVLLTDTSISVFIFVEMVVFIGMLALGLIYAWAKGALEWV